MELKPGYKHTEVGMIPQDWKVSTVGDEFHIQLGKMLDADKNVGVPKPFLGNRAVQWGRINVTDIGLIKLSPSDLQRFRLREGDLLVCEGGEVGRSAIWRQSLDECYYQKALHRLRPKKGFNVPFMQNILHKYSVEGLLQNYVTQTSIAHLPKDKFQTLPIPVPSPVEQQAIAETLSDVDALIELLDARLTKKRQVKQGVMQALLTGQIRLTGFYGAWEPIQLKQIVQTPITDGPHLTPKFQGDGVPFLSVNNLVNNRIDFSDLRFISIADHEVFSRKCRPRKGDILLGKAASVGKVALVESDIDFNIWSPIAMIRVSSSYCSRFIFYQLQSMSLVRQIALLTNSSSQGNIGMGDIERLVVGCPHYDEQIAISTIISAHDDEIEMLETKLQKARHLKQGMMQELLTGRVRLV